MNWQIIKSPKFATYSIPDMYSLACQKPSGETQGERFVAQKHSEKFFPIVFGVFEILNNAERSYRPYFTNVASKANDIYYVGPEMSRIDWCLWTPETMSKYQEFINEAHKERRHQELIEKLDVLEKGIKTMVYQNDRTDVVEFANSVTSSLKK